MADLIDRAALVHDLIHNRSFYPVCVRRAIEDAPTIEAEPVKHGHWKAQKIMGNRRGTVRRSCSACGRSNGNRKSNFCPNCGAKMESGVKEYVNER